MIHIAPPLEGPFRPRVQPRPRLALRPLWAAASLLLSASAVFATAWALL